MCLFFIQLKNIYYNNLQIKYNIILFIQNIYLLIKIKQNLKYYQKIKKNIQNQQKKYNKIKWLLLQKTDLSLTQLTQTTVYQEMITYTVPQKHGKLKEKPPMVVNGITKPKLNTNKKMVNQLVLYLMKLKFNSLMTNTISGSELEEMVTQKYTLIQVTQPLLDKNQTYSLTQKPESTSKTSLSDLVLTTSTETQLLPPELLLNPMLPLTLTPPQPTELSSNKETYSTVQQPLSDYQMVYLLNNTMLFQVMKKITQTYMYNTNLTKKLLVLLQVPQPEPQLTPKVTKTLVLKYLKISNLNLYPLLLVLPPKLEMLPQNLKLIKLQIQKFLGKNLQTNNQPLLLVVNQVQVMYPKLLISPNIFLFLSEFNSKLMFEKILQILISIIIKIKIETKIKSLFYIYEMNFIIIILKQKLQQQHTNCILYYQKIYRFFFYPFIFFLHEFIQNQKPQYFYNYNIFIIFILFSIKSIINNWNFQQFYFYQKQLLLRIKKKKKMDLIINYYNDFSYYIFVTIIQNKILLNEKNFKNDGYYIISLDVILMYFGHFLCLILSLILLFLKFNCSFREFYMIIVGIIVQYIVFEEDFLYFFILIITNYIITKYFQNCGKISLVISCLTPAILSQYYIFSQHTVYGFMTLACKCVTYSFSIQDGKEYQKNKDLQKNDYDTPQEGNKLNKIQQYQFDNMIRVNDEQDNSFKRYLGYIFFLPTIIFAPQIQYGDYRKVIKNIYEDNSIIHKFKTMLWAFSSFFLGVTLKYLTQAYLDIIFETNIVKCLCTVEFRNSSFLRQLILINLHGVLQRLIFYILAFVQDSVTIAIGIGYSKKENRINKYQQYRILEMEMEWDINIKASQYWNIQTHNWLFYNVYTRIFSSEQIKKSFFKKQLSSLIAYTIQGILHGTYSGFILFSQQSMAMDFVTRTVRNMFQDKNYKKSKLFVITRWIFFNAWLNVFVCNFRIKNWKDNYYFSETLYHIPILLLIISTLLCLIYKIIVHKFYQNSKA